MVKIPNGDGDESTLYWGKIWTVIFTDAIESQCNMDSIRGYTVISSSEAWWKPDLCLHWFMLCSMVLYRFKFIYN